MLLRDYGPDEKCDGCGHALKWHRRDSGRCVVAESWGRITPAYAGQRPPYARQCWCDGWFPIPPKP